ncbi:splicing regulator SDE2-like [Ptychodera flava]|uniref:splicing regulator SDE2-like n=1 Tax=Ptychodera flava TaxID=63121 RepID=UPI00396A2633
MSALCTFNGQLRCVDLDDGMLYNARRLKSQICQDKGLDADDFYVVWNGKIVEDEAKLRTDAIYHVCFRLPGGKGGFGSMLRMIGAQIEKTTNREACRDLSGRRLRDVNDEKRLAEWLKKQADKERERQARKREKLERMASEPKHIFNDQKYSQQKESIMENVHDALSQGMQAAATEAAVSSGSSMKRKSNGKGHSGGKKQRLWLGVDFVDSSSDDGDDDDEEEEEETEEDKEMKKLCQKYLDEMKRKTSMEPGSDGDWDNQASCSYKSQTSDSAPSSSRGSSGEVTGEADCVEPAMQRLIQTQQSVAQKTGKAVTEPLENVNTVCSAHFLRHGMTLKLTDRLTYKQDNQKKIRLVK